VKSKNERYRLVSKQKLSKARIFIPLAEVLKRICFNALTEYNHVQCQEEKTRTQRFKKKKRHDQFHPLFFGPLSIQGLLTHNLSDDLKLGLISIREM